MNSHGLQDRQYLGSVGNMDGGRWRPSADDPGGHGPPRLAPRRADSPKLRTSLFYKEQFKGASREITAKLT